MNFICQNSAIAELQTLAKSNRHSILIEGAEGSGKSYLAMQYAQMLGIGDFQQIVPKVDVLKETIDACLQLNNPVVLCIENLDLGVAGAAYVLLKFLEEPLPNTYIVVTCRNIKNVPDTIISRSAVVVTAPPVELDISTYALSKNADRFRELKGTRLWNCVRTFKDADTVMNMNSTQLDYFNGLESMAQFRDTVSNLVWKISHYTDNSETPVDLVIRYLMNLINTTHIKKAGIECMRDLSQGRIASHAVLARFVFEAKYCE